MSFSYLSFFIYSFFFVGGGEGVSTKLLEMWDQDVICRMVSGGGHIKASIVMVRKFDRSDFDKVA